MSTIYAASALCVAIHAVPKGAVLPVRLPHSRNDLPAYFAECGYTRGAEIGVWQGRFSERLCAANPRLHLLCVDPWLSYKAWKDPKNEASRMADAEADARRRLARFNTQIVKAFSVEAAKSVPDGSLDWVYIDANHGRAAVTADLEAWVPKVRSGGVVSGHDYLRGRDHLEVAEAIDTYTSAHEIAPWYVLAADKSPSWLWVKR